jgi:hypothetical protein
MPTFVFRFPRATLQPKLNLRARTTMSYTDEFEREWRNAQARARYAWKKQNAEKAKQPYTPKIPPEPGSLHERFVQLLKPIDFGEECMVQNIARAAARLDFVVRLRNEILASPTPARDDLKSANECYEIAKKSLRTQVAHFRSRRPTPRKKTITKQTHFGG